MSEQVIIDREAPPWAQRLQTDLNAVLARMDRRWVTMRDAAWRDGGDLTRIGGAENVEFTVPEEARLIKVEGIYQPSVASTGLALRFGPTAGNYHNGVADYANHYMLSNAGVVTSGNYSSSIVDVVHSTHNVTFAHFTLKIARASYLDRMAVSVSTSGYYGVLDFYTIQRATVGPSLSGSNRFFALLPNTALGELRARMEYRT